MKLPVGQKFTIYVDDEGDYVIQLQSSTGLAAHGRTP